jgi:hypothetical protein
MDPIMLLNRLLDDEELEMLQETDPLFHLPDFARPDYPYDLPYYRRPFYVRIFEQAGVPRRCPIARCRRSGKCEGADGPPCYRADRARLNRLLNRVYTAFNEMSEEAVARAALELEEAFSRTPPRTTCRKGDDRDEPGHALRKS